MSSQTLIGPVFLSEMIISKRYFRMLQNDFLPQLMSIGLPLQKQRFMLDGIAPHTVNVVLDFFQNVFGLRVVSNAVRLVTIAATFGHLRAVHCISVTSLYGLS